MFSNNRKNILNKIKSLVSTRGFIYSLCLIIVEDFHIKVGELHEVDSRSRLNKNEVMLLLGFLVQHEISTEYPDSLKGLVKLKNRTYELMNELHTCLSSPNIEKLNTALNNKSKEKDSISNIYSGDNSFVEPIFYAGDGVYDFQYNDYLDKKYKYDKEWLRENADFEIDHIRRIMVKINELLLNKFNQVHFLSLKENKKRIFYELKKSKAFSNSQLKKYSDEFALGLELFQYADIMGFDISHGKIFGLNSVPENKLSTFYDSLLDLFIIKKEDFDDSYNINSFLSNFSIFNNDKNINSNLNDVGDYNIISGKPIIQINGESYFIPILFSLHEAIYESPYYWMLKDESYKDELASNRGKTGEEITYEILEPIFGSKNIFKSVKIESKKGFDSTDIDILCIYGNKAICIQVKSKKLTLVSRSGNYDQLLKDFNGAVKDAYNQALLSRNSILNRKSKFYDEQGNRLNIPQYINDVYLLVVTTENYPAITHQANILLQKSPNQPYPLVATIFDLELLTHYLNQPYKFLHYIRQRTELMDYYYANEEPHFLGFYLLHKLWKDPKYGYTVIDPMFGQYIDQNYFPLKKGIDIISKNDKIRTRKINPHFETLCMQISDLNAPEKIDVIFHFLDLSEDSQNYLINNLLRAKHNTLNDLQMHSFTIVPGFERAHFGTSYISLNNNNIYELEKRLNFYSILRKYKSRADLWVGMGSLFNSEKLVDTIFFIKENWKYNSTYEEHQKVVFDNNTGVQEKYGRKIGRNEYCPCGSGKKYKKCCGRNY